VIFLYPHDYAIGNGEISERVQCENASRPNSNAKLTAAVAGGIILYVIYIGLFARKKLWTASDDVARTAMSSSAKKMMSGLNVHCIM